MCIRDRDIIAMDPRTVITESGYIKSRFLDDKLSAAILLGVAHKKYQVAISYDFGLVEVAKDLGMKNRNLMISLGYMF